MNTSNSILSLSNLSHRETHQTNRLSHIASLFPLIWVSFLPAILSIWNAGIFRLLTFDLFSSRQPYFQGEFPRKDGLDLRRGDYHNDGKHPFLLEYLQNEASKKSYELGNSCRVSKILSLRMVFYPQSLRQSISNKIRFLRPVSRIFQETVLGLLTSSYFSPVRAFALRTNTGNVWGSWPPFVLAFSAFKFCNRKRLEIFWNHNRNIDIFHTFNLLIIRLQSRIN